MSNPEHRLDKRWDACRVCGRATLVIVNINFKATPVCNDCCLTITKQTVSSLTLRSLEVPFE